MKNILFVSDLDGTLLNNQKKLSAESVEILNSLLKKGLKFTVSTARTPATLQGILSPLSLTLPVCCMNGAAIYSFSKNTYIKTFPIDADLVFPIIKICENGGVFPFIHVIKDNFLYVFYETITSSPEKAFYEERQNLPLKKYINSPYQPSFGSPVYFTILGLEKNVKNIIDSLKPFKDRITLNFYEDIYNKGYYYLEICHCGASKSFGAEYIKTISEAEKIYAFGDNTNDLPMLILADKSFAVANAAEAVKQSCTHIIGANTQNSVAKAIKEIFLNPL